MKVTAPEELETGEKAHVVVEVGSIVEEAPTGEVVLSVDGTDLPGGGARERQGDLRGRPVQRAEDRGAGGEVRRRRGAPTPGQGRAQVKVVAPAPVTTPPTPPNAANPAVKVPKGGKVDATKNRRKAKLVLGCGSVACEGKVVLKTRGKDGKRLGAGAFDMDARDKGTVVLKLNKKARALLGKKASLKVVLVVRHDDGSTQRVKVRLKR